MQKFGATIIPVTPFEQNCSLIWCEETKKAFLIDPGGDVDYIRQAIAQTGVSVDRILLTHGHVDHVGGATELKEALGVPIEGPHEAEEFLLSHVTDMGARFGLGNLRNVAPDRWLSDGDEVRAGNLSFDVVHCPGHSPGSVVYVNRALKLAVVGDVLFAGSIGRSDLPGGDHDTLIRSIKQKLLPLGDDIGFISGHGPTSTFGHEREHNPFLV